MEPKYKKGQKVKIIAVTDRQGKPKYAHNKRYLGEKGVVLDSFHLGNFHVLYYKDHLSHDAYIYKVRLHNSQTVVTAGSTSQRYESLFPPGIPVGTVTKVDDEELDVYQRVHVKPYAQLRRLDVVQVLTKPQGGGEASG